MVKHKLPPQKAEGLMEDVILRIVKTTNGVEKEQFMSVKDWRNFKGQPGSIYIAYQTT